MTQKDVEFTATVTFKYYQGGETFAEVYGTTDLAEAAGTDRENFLADTSCLLEEIDGSDSYTISVEAREIDAT